VAYVDGRTDGRAGGRVQAIPPQSGVTACVYKLLSPVHTSNNVEATFDFVAKNGNNVERVLR